MRYARAFLPAFFALLPLQLSAAGGPQFNTDDVLSKEQVAAQYQERLNRIFPNIPDRMRQEMVKNFQQEIIKPYFGYPGAPQEMDSRKLNQIIMAQKAFTEVRQVERQLKKDPDNAALKARLAQAQGRYQEMEQRLQQSDQRLGQLFDKFIQEAIPGGGGSHGGHGGHGSGPGGHEQEVDCRRSANPILCLINKAARDREEGNQEEALNDLNAALALDPDNVDALRARSQINSDAGLLAQANADARRILELDPSDKAAMALYKLSEGRGDRQAQEPPGQAADPAAGAAQGAGAGAGRPAQPPSQTAFNKASTSGALRSAMDLMRLGDMPGALSHLNRALAADPNSLEAYRLRAMAYARQGSYDSALRDAEAGLRLSSKDAGLLIAKSFAKNRLKDYRGALEAAGLAREIDPDSVDAMANYAYALGGVGERDRMLGLLEQAAAKDPRYAASLASARGTPAGSSVLFLFPGESPLGNGSAQAYGPQADRPSRNKRFGLLAVATIIGGVLLALGLLQSVAGPVMTHIKTVFTHKPESSAQEAGGPALSAPVMPADGLLRGQFKVLRQIGSGGMGLVFEGTDVTLSRQVAIKQMREELRLDRRERLRFVNEAKTVASLHHPNIVDIYAIIEDGDDIFLVFEYVSGKTVHDIISRRGSLGFKEALSITRSMVAALEFAHGRSVIHRDLKPSNVMISDEGYIKVMDFGIARIAKDVATRCNMTNTVVGTPPYMAPEQEQGIVRKEADVYSLAICVYEMLCGHVPFTGTGAGMLMNKVNMAYVPVSKMAKGLPEGLDGVFARALDADPDKRFHSGQEFLGALEALAAPSRA